MWITLLCRGGKTIQYNILEKPCYDMTGFFEHKSIKDHQLTISGNHVVLEKILS